MVHARIMACAASNCGALAGAGMIDEGSTKLPGATARGGALRAAFVVEKRDGAEVEFLDAFTDLAPVPNQQRGGARRPCVFLCGAVDGGELGALKLGGLAAQFLGNRQFETPELGYVAGYAVQRFELLRIRPGAVRLRIEQFRFG